MEDNKRVQLEDMLAYTPEQYFSDEEVAILHAHFKGEPGKKLMKVIRKAMLPTISDPELPIEQFGNDPYVSGLDWKMMQAEEAKAIALGMQEAVKRILGGLIHVMQIAHVKDETPAERAERLRKNSAK